jgi:hypothetical protein
MNLATIFSSKIEFNAQPTSSYAVDHGSNPDKMLEIQATSESVNSGKSDLEIHTCFFAITFAGLELVVLNSATAY